MGDRRGKTERFEDAGLLSLKMEGGTMRQVMHVAFRSWKRQRKRFSPRTSRKTTPCQSILDFLCLEL